MSGGGGGFLQKATQSDTILQGLSNGDFVLRTTTASNTLALGLGSNVAPTVVLRDGRMGVGGVLEPSAAVDVVGDIHFTGALRSNGQLWNPSRWETVSGTSNLTFMEGRVGVGVADPQFALDVAGDINIVDGRLMSNGQVFKSSQWTTQSNGDIYFHDANARVAVGKSNANFRLDVEGDINVSGGNLMIDGLPYANYSRSTVVTSGGILGIDVSEAVAFEENQKITPADPEAFEYFGQDAMAVSSQSGTHMVVGSKNKIGGNGKIYFYSRNSLNPYTSWADGNTFVGNAGDEMGASVAMSRDGVLAVVGAPGNAKAYVFVRNGYTWALTATLTTEAGIRLGTRVAVSAPDAGYNYYVAVSDPEAIMGQGRVHIFHGNNDSWTPCFDPFVTVAGMAPLALWGSALHMSEDGAFLAVGAPGVGAGTAHVFARGNVGAQARWSQQVVLEGTAAGDRFGTAVSLSGDGKVLAVGSPQSSTVMGIRSGSVYIFHRSGEVWTMAAKMVGNDTTTGDELGSAVAIDASGTSLVVSSLYDNNMFGVASGSAYIFYRSPASGWTFLSKLVSNNSTANSGFGNTVAITERGAFVAVGASAQSHTVSSAGLVYWFLSRLQPFQYNTPQNTVFVDAAYKQGKLQLGVSNASEIYLGSNAAMVIFGYQDSNQRIGLHTVNPEYSTHIVGDTGITGETYVHGTIVIDNEASVGSLGVGVFNSPSLFHVLGTDMATTNIVVDFNNHVGIGTFDPRPVRTLDVVGDAAFLGKVVIQDQDLGSWDCNMEVAASTALFHIYSAISPATVYVQDDGLIGVHMSNPSYPLDINGDTRIEGSAFVRDFLYASNLAVGCFEEFGSSNPGEDYLLHVRQSNAPAASLLIRRDGMIGVHLDYPEYPVDVVGDMRVSANVMTSNLGVGLLDVDHDTLVHVASIVSPFSVVVKDNGMIGLHKAVPEFPLDVVGDVHVVGDMYQEGNMRLMNNELAASNLGVGVTDINALLHVACANPADDGTDNTAALVVQHDGRVGIHVHDPKYTLHVDGNSRQSGRAFVDDEVYAERVGVGASNLADDIALFHVHSSNSPTLIFADELGRLGIHTNVMYRDLNIQRDTSILGDVYHEGSAYVTTQVYTTHVGIGVSNSDALLHVTSALGNDPVHFIYADIFGRVGIHNGNPQHELDLVGSVAVSDTVYGGSQVYTPHLEIRPSHVGSWGQLPDTDIVHVETLGGANTLVINSDGFVGINTPAPERPLDVVGEVRVMGPAFVHDQVVSTHVGAGTGVSNSDGILHVASAVDGYPYTLKVTADGSMIGIHQPSPIRELDVVGSIEVSEEAFIQQHVFTNNLTVGVSNSDGLVHFYSSNEGGVDLFYVSSNTFIGVHTTLPEYTVDVLGDVNVSERFLVEGVKLLDRNSFVMSRISNVVYLPEPFRLATGSNVTYAEVDFSSNHASNAEIMCLRNRTSGPGTSASMMLISGNTQQPYDPFVDTTPPVNVIEGGGRMKGGTRPDTGESYIDLGIWTGSEFRDYLFVRSNGYIGIGTSNAQTPIEVWKEGYHMEVPLLTLRNYAPMPTGSNANVVSLIMAPTMYQDQVQGKITAAAFSNGEGYLGFSTNGASNALRERMRITSTGHFGLGVENPVHFMDCRKNTNGPVWLSLNNNTDGSMARTGMVFGKQAGAQGYLVYHHDQYAGLGMYQAQATVLAGEGFGGLNMGTTRDVPIRLYTNGAPRMFIGNNGRYGLNVAAPQEGIDYSTTVDKARLKLQTLAAGANAEAGVLLNTTQDGKTWVMAHKASETFMEFAVHDSTAGYRRRAYLYEGRDASDLNFTGQHRCVAASAKLLDAKHIGKIVVASTNSYVSMVNNAPKVGKEAITISESLPVVDLCTQQADQRVFGVIAEFEDPSQDVRTNAYGNLITAHPKEKGDGRLCVNSLGEGAMWVAETEAGGLKAGDYIQASAVPGFGERQSDGVLRNCTVAKITMDCDFRPSTVPRRRIARRTVTTQVEETVMEEVEEVGHTYTAVWDAQAGRYLQKKEEVRTPVKRPVVDVYPLFNEEGGQVGEHTVERKVTKTVTSVENVVGEDGLWVWEEVPGEEEPEYEVRWVDVMTGEWVEEAVGGGEGRVRVAYVGVTYHCG